MHCNEAGSILCRTGWLSRQPAPFQQRLLAASMLRRHPAGDFVVAEGDLKADLHGLAEGELSVLFAPVAAAPALLHVARPGWWGGDAAMIIEGPRRAALVARRTSWVLHVSNAAIHAMARDDAEVWRRLAQITVGHLDHALSVVASLTIGDARARVAMALRRLVDLEARGTRGVAEVWVSQTELGTMTHLSRNAVAQMLGELEAMRMIRRRYRRIELLDLGALNKLLRQTRPSRIDDDGA